MLMIFARLKNFSNQVEVSFHRASVSRIFMLAALVAIPTFQQRQHRIQFLDRALKFCNRIRRQFLRLGQLVRILKRFVLDPFERIQFEFARLYLSDAERPRWRSSVGRGRGSRFARPLGSGP